jgi:nitrous oxide reductase
LEKDKEADEVTRLKDQFKDMELRGNAKVTNDRVFSMAVHPDKTKDLVFVGDKYGSLGMSVHCCKCGNGADLQMGCSGTSY